MVYTFAYIEGVAPEADAIKAEIEVQDEIEQTYEGMILDSDGNVLCCAVEKGSGGAMLKQGRKEVLSEVASKETIAVVKNALLETAIHYGIDEERGSAFRDSALRIYDALELLEER